MYLEIGQFKTRTVFLIAQKGGLNLAENNFIIELIARLNKSASKKQVQTDAENLGKIKIPLIGTLNKRQTRQQIKQDLASLNETVNITGKVDKNGVVKSVQQATQQAQKDTKAKPIEINFSVKKDKLINDIKLLGKQNSRLFKDAGMTSKYNNLLDNAQLAASTQELNNLRLQLGAFRSEIKVAGKTGMTFIDALKSGLSKVLQLFGGYNIVMQFTKQLRNAWKEAKELDSALTDLSRVNSDISRSDFSSYLDKVIDKAKKLSVAIKDCIDATTTFSRAGYNLIDSEVLAAAAVQLEKVGDMDAESASKALLAGLQGYAEIDGYGMDQLAEKAQALNDKIDIIGNTASITQKEVAQGIQAVGSVMSDANTSVDEFISLLGAGNRAVQDSNKVALAIRTSALRIRGCTVELQEMGEETDDVIESTSTLAAKIKALTNIDGSGGVNILEADEETFRSIYDIYNDIAKVYDKMSDKDASALLDLIAGKNRSNQISAILNNMSEANELLDRSLNAAGTASDEYQIYLDSAEAATERFGVAMTETYNNILNGETVKSLADAGTAVLNFANSFGIVEGTVKGFLALGLLKGMTTLTIAFKNSAVQVSNYGVALSTVNKLDTVRNTQKYVESMNTLKVSCIGLTEARLKQVLANNALGESERVAILMERGLSKAQAQAKLAQMGLTQTTNAQTAANGAATASTFSLKAAVTGLGASIKMAFLSNPVGIAIMAVSTAIGFVSSAISKHNQAVEEARQKAIELTNAYKEQRDSLDSQIAKYKELKETLDNGNLSTDEARSIKEQLLEIQKSLIDSYGNEASNIDLVNGKYKEQLGLLSELSKEKATDYVAENRDVFEDAKEELEKIRTYTINGIVNWNTLSPKTEDQQALLDFIESYSELFDITADGSSNYASGQFDVRNLVIKADVESADEIMRQFYDDLDQFGKDNNIDVSGILEGISGQLKKTTADEFKEYKTIYDEFMKAEIVRNDTLRPLYQQSIQAVEDYNNALSSGEGVAEAKSNLDSVQQSVQNAAGELEGSQKVFDDIYNGINKNAESAYNLAQSFENNESVKGFAEQLRGLADIDLQAINFKDNVQSPGEEAFGALIDILGLSEDEVQNLIDKLVEFGFVQGKVQDDSIQNSELPLSTITSSIEQIATQLEPQFQKLGDAYKNIFTADGFTLDAVDNSMLEDLRKTFTEIEEEIGVTFDTTQLENFFAVLSNSNSTAKQTQEAFNNIATSYLYSTDVLESLNSTTVDSIAKQLESLGITNASQLATEALAAKEEYLAFARREHTDEAGNLVSVTQDLANATADDINVLIAEQGALEGEGIALDEATQKMIAYWIQKQAANGQLSTVGDIQQLSALCEGLGVSSKALRNYIYFKKLASMTDVYDAASIERFSANAEKNMEQAQADIQSIYGKLGGAEINFAVPDTSKKSKSEKDTTKEFDWVEQAIENVEKEVNKLDEIVNSAYSTFSQKNEALAKEIGKVNEEIELQQQAYDEYMRKADSIGLSDDYKTLIHDGAINIENISDKNLQDKISEYQQWYDKAVDAADAISELSTKVKDLHVTGYELQADRLEELLDNEAITEKRYLSEMDKLYKQYYENQTDYAVQAHEAKIALLNKEKEYLNSVANAATSLLDKEINKVQDNAKEQQKPYEDQIKAAEKQKEIYQDQIKAEEKKIDAYNKEIDLINDKKKPLQDELDALEDKARQENLILDLQKKQYELKRAENQKDKLVYTKDGMIYTNDDTKVRDAKKEVDDAELEIQKYDIQKQIDALDEEIEKYNELIDAVNDHIDSINEQIDAVDDYIDGLNDIVDQIGDAADAQVEALEKTKNKWQEVIDQQEEAQNMLLLTGEFGADAIRKILTGNDDDLLAKWKENYITTLSEIDSETQGYIGDMTEQLAGLYNVDLSPMQAQFNNVKESISGMTDSLGSAVNTIIGKGVESVMGGNQDSAQSTTPAPNVQGGTAGSLADAFTQVGNTATDVIGNPGAEGDGTVIGEFGSMKTAVNDVTDAISTGDGSLENAILEETETALDAFDQHTDKINNEVIPAIQSATNEMNAFNETADRDIEKTITIKYETVGSPASNVTTGAAHVEGTANVQGDWSVQTSEKHSLVGEVGRELIVRDGRFFTVGDNGAEMFPIKKGDIVFNHEQTEELLKNGHISGHGKAYADGTVGGGKVLLPDGQVLFRVPDDSPLFDLRRKAEAYMEKTGSKLEEVLKPVNAIHHHFEEIEKIIDNSTYNNIVNNNQPSIVLNGGINITCPGVRDPEVMRNLHRLIDDEFVGLRIAAYQQVMRSR